MGPLIERNLRGIGRRLVQINDRFGEMPEPARLARPWRQRLGEVRGIARQRAVHEFAQHILGEPRGRRINGRQPIG